MSVTNGVWTHLVHLCDNRHMALTNDSFRLRSTVGTRIRDARTRGAQQMTRTALGEVLGVSANTIGRWERDAVEISLDDAIGVAETLQVPLEWLAFGDGPVAQSVRADSSNLDARVIRLPRSEPMPVAA